MKKLLIILGFTLSVSPVFSQMNTGSYFLSGSIPLNLQLYSGKDIVSDTKQGYQSIQFAPKGGYFLKNRLAVGGMVDYSLYRNSEKYDGGKSSNKSTTLLLGPLGRYYFNYGDFLPFAEAFLGIGRTNSKYVDEFGGETTETNSAHSVFKTAVGGGAHCFLSDALAFEALMQYFWESQRATEGDGGHNYTGILLMVGITIYFGSI